jgi:small neutral amino acid transporter SnatA (MarC family)
MTGDSLHWLGGTSADFFAVAGAQFVLLNPFLMTIYLLDVIRELSGAQFARVLLRAGLISSAVFVLFVVTGDALFRDLLQVRFASFMLFGGLIWLAIGFRFVLSGREAFTALRGSAGHVAGAIAMPFMIGPGTISASILAGASLTPLYGSLAMLAAVGATVGCVLLLKLAHDRVREAYSGLVERYIDLVGRTSALVIGTFAVEMILRGVELWLAAWGRTAS